MNTARVKAQKSKGCSPSFGSFELIYPQNLYGVIEPLEFETTVKSINEKCHSVLPKNYLLLFLPSLIGFILTICGIVKFVKQANEMNNDGHVSMISSSSGFAQSSISSSSGTASSSISSSSISSISSITGNWPPYKDLNGIDMSVSGPTHVDRSGSIALIVIGMLLMMAGCCSYGIAFFIFTKKVISKIEAELETINQHFLSRRITWSLESEIQVKYISDFEYNSHKNNSAYMQKIKFDRDNRPYKEVTVYFIEIQFPASPNSPSSSNSSSSNHSHISIGINGTGNQVSFDVNSSSISTSNSTNSTTKGGYTSIPMNEL